MSLPLAAARVFEKSHLEAHAAKAPPPLAELAVHCLELVAELTEAGLDFCFKGGNSLLLVLSEPRRLSIDVDIATPESADRVLAAVEKVIARHKVFTHHTHRQHKTKPWLPMTSFELFFDSHYGAPGTRCVMLDVMLKRIPYAIQRKRAACGNLYDSAVQVQVPTPAGIVGDKLLTLGPATLGIPLGKNKEAQRLKHSFDLSRLAEQNLSLAELHQSINACLAAENEMQRKTLTLKEAADDTLRYCHLPLPFASSPAETEVNDPALAEIVRGRPGLAEHLFAGEYSWEQLKYDLSRAALCMAAAAGNCDEASFLKALRNTSPQDNWDAVARIAP